MSKIRIPWTWWELFYFIQTVWWSFFFILEMLFTQDLLWIFLALGFGTFCGYSFTQSRKERLKK